MTRRVEGQPPIDGLELPDPGAPGAKTLWHAAAYAAVAAEARTGRQFTLYDAVRKHRVPEPEHPNHWGLLAQELRRDGVIVPAGFATGTRPSVAGSAVRVWRGAHQAVA